MFTTAHTQERHLRFQWIEPLTKDVTMLVRLPGSDGDQIDETLEEALTRDIGTQVGDYTLTILQELGASNIHQSPKVENTVKMLQAGHVDYVALSEQSVNEMRAMGYDLEIAMFLSEDVFSIACSHQTSKDLVERMRVALREIVADGTQARILSSYD